MSTNQIISKVWSFCNTIRDDGVGWRLPGATYLPAVLKDGRRIYQAALQPYYADSCDAIEEGGPEETRPYHRRKLSNRCRRIKKVNAQFLQHPLDYPCYAYLLISFQ